MVRLKHLALLLLFLVSLKGYTQVPSSCEIPQNLQNAYAHDVADLAVKRLDQINSPDTSQITIPQIHKDSIWDGLSAIYNASTLTGRDSVYEIFCIHQENQNMRLHKDILVYTDSTCQWTDNWQNLNSITGNSELDYLIDHYGFSIESYHALDYDIYNARIKLITDQNINTFAFCDSLETFDGIHHANPNFSYIQGNYIDYNVIDGVKYIDFSLASCGFDWGTCYYYTWKYEVYQDCYVDFIGIDAETYSLPDPVNCNITTGSANNLSADELISVYPNPTAGVISIAINEAEAGINSLEVTSIQGSIILKKNTVPDNLELDLPNGLYFLKFSNEDNVYIKKLTINK